jgi:hypothetical protein
MIKLPRKNDWLIDPEIFHAAIDELLKCFKIIDTFDIPYVAGYSENGRHIYIDKDMPEGYVSKKEKGAFVATDRYLIVHEGIEKILLMYFKSFNPIPHLYQLAHQIALRVEKLAVETDGHDWDEYNVFMAEWIKEIAEIEITNIPIDIDLEPYIDEDDYALLSKNDCKT